MRTPPRFAIKKEAEGFEFDAYNLCATLPAKEIAVSARPAPKKATNLSINADLLCEAKALKINLSQAFEAYLTELVTAKRKEKWLEENRDAINAYNQFVDEHGVFSDGWRSF